MKVKRIIAGMLGVILSWMMVFWPARVMAQVTHMGIHKQVIMGDDDDDDILPPPPYTVPRPESYTPGTGG